MGKQVVTLSRVGSGETRDHGQAGVPSRKRRQQTAGYLVAARDAAEDRTKQDPHTIVAEQDLKRLGDPLTGGAAADVEEVGGPAAGCLDTVKQAHHQAGAVTQHADLPGKRDVGKAGFLGTALTLILYPRVTRRTRGAERGRLRRCSLWHREQRKTPDG